MEAETDAQLLTAMTGVDNGPSRMAAAVLGLPVLGLSVLGLSVLGTMLVACQSPTCGGGQQPYNNVCLDSVAVTYIECTKGRGFDLSTELGGKLGGTFKVIADASVEAAYKSSQEENTAVSLQVVSDCLKIAESTAATAQDKSAAGESRARADSIRQQVAGTAHLTVSPSRAQAGSSLVVSGTNFYPDETVAIYVHAALVTQVTADGAGAFTATVTVPQSVFPGLPTAVTAAGATSAKTAQAPFEATP